jgi:hypothetical protein
VLIAAIGTGWCFALNAAPFAAVLLALLAIRPGELYRSATSSRRPARPLDGVRWALGRDELRTPLIAMVLAGVLAFNLPVLLPLMAKFAFHGDSRTTGCCSRRWARGRSPAPCSRPRRRRRRGSKWR